MAGPVCFVDKRIWWACAGSTVHVPDLHSRVYYFPHGHWEQASSAPSCLSPLLRSRPFVLCRVMNILYLADPSTDEVFCRMILHPICDSPAVPFFSDVANGTLLDIDKNSEIVSHAKILTPSDANNGGGFSIPRICADSIFPPLDLMVDFPVQKVSVTDIHGTVWIFRHVYRGTPKRHLLTTGWSKFVDRKNLVAGDSVVFMKNCRGEMFVGIRRGVRSSRSGKEPAEAVAETAEMAAKDMPFEVSHYPRAGWSDFVVSADLVEKAISVAWSPGFRVKISMDSSKTTWFHGSISGVHSLHDRSSQDSPWRMLEVKWDEPDAFQNGTRLNPWEVEVIRSIPPQLNPPVPPLKKSRADQNSGIHSHEGKEQSFSNLAMEKKPPLLNNHETVPAGMQGARQKLKNVSTELVLGGSQSEDSPESHTSVLYLGTQLTGNQIHNPTKVADSSFMLFGQIINVKLPDESDADDRG